MCILTPDSFPADTGGVSTLTDPSGYFVSTLGLVDDTTYTLQVGDVYIPFFYDEDAPLPDITIPPKPSLCANSTVPISISDSPVGAGVNVGSFTWTVVDCDGNGQADWCELLAAPGLDCNGNGVLDACDILNGDAVDCNGNGIPDTCDLASGTSQDCNANAVPDECDISTGLSLDCNLNGIPDSCDLLFGTSPDCNGNGIPDECDLVAGIELDCNGNGVPDFCDFSSGYSLDCNGNGVPDECDISSGFSTDCNGNGLPDLCEIAADPGLDCNSNGQIDSCDVFSGFSKDCNANMIPDECEDDCNGNQIPDSCDLLLPGVDQNQNGILDECEPALTSMLPASGGSALGATVDLLLPYLPDGPAELLIDTFVVPISIFSEVAQATIPPLQAASAGDVIADAIVRWNTAQGLEETPPLPAAFTWTVPTITNITPSVLPYDSGGAVVIELVGNNLNSGPGQVRFGGTLAQLGTWFQLAGTTYVATYAPPQSAPGDYPIELEITSGGVTEFTLLQARGLVYLGPGITNMSSISGFQGGGESLTFDLVDFEPGLPITVSFGPAQSVGTPTGLLAASSMTVLTPFSPSSGIVDVTLTQSLPAGQTKTVTSPSAFEFIPPSIGTFSITSGPQAGGSSLVIGTDGFEQGTIDITMGGGSSQGTVQGFGASQTVSMVTPAAVTPGLTDVRFEQGIFDVTTLAAFDYLAPTVLAVTPTKGAWYEGHAITISGQNFAPGVVADISVEGAPVLTGVVLDSSTITANIPQDFITSAGKLDVTLSQAGVAASSPGAWTSLPALDFALTGDSVGGGNVALFVDSANGGVAYVFISSGLSPSTLPIADIHYALELDLIGAQSFGTAALIPQPTVSYAFAGGLIPVGTKLAFQVLAFEAGTMGLKYSFTNGVEFIIP